MELGQLSIYTMQSSQVLTSVISLIPPLMVCNSSWDTVSKFIIVTCFCIDSNCLSFIIDYTPLFPFFEKGNPRNRLFF